MNLWRQLIFRSLRFHARGHFGALLGTAVAGTVLVGALAVGDCVTESLREMALARLGRIGFALPGKDRLFREGLADDLRPAISNGLAAAALQLPCTAANSEGSARANHAQILGVDEHFWALAATSPALPRDWQEGAVLNEALARQWGAKAGDTVLLRAQKPSLLSLEEPISPQQDASAGFRLVVKAIVSDEELGRFGLQANQIPPMNAFVGLHFLQGKAGLPGKANLLLTGEGATTAQLTELLRSHWKLADAQCELRQTPGGLELRSERVFLDPPIAEAAAGLTSQPQLERVLTYFVNEFRDGTNTTPYSMVTAAGEPLVPVEMRDDEIVINQWLADDLQAKPGDELELTYFIPGTTKRMEEVKNTFRIRAVLPMSGPNADRTLLPDFPGIAKAESTANWDAGFPIDLGKIRPKDEQYWKEFRGTPKAFVTLTAGRRMWGNRFGNLTAIRFQGGAQAAEVGSQLLSKLNPEDVGLAFLPVREQALTAAATGQAQEFGGLFLSFSFFLIAAALILVAMLFQLALKTAQRRSAFCWLWDGVPHWCGGGCWAKER